jgi:2-polyprenyl-3-methyl-5-hydroxy-6-metoxy-1,4-benzoquinol methylase
MTSIHYYDTHAESFFANTVNANMAAPRARFCRHLAPSARILDAGCGSGRDAAAFAANGYRVTAFDASSAMVKLASAHLGFPALQMCFEDVCWKEEFDGIWACASLLHVSNQALPAVLCRLADALRPGGVLYGSFKQGSGEVERDGRSFTNYTPATLAVMMQAVPVLSPVEVWESADVRPERNEAWLNFIYRRLG